MKQSRQRLCHESSRNYLTKQNLQIQALHFPIQNALIHHRVFQWSLKEIFSRLMQGLTMNIQCRGLTVKCKLPSRSNTEVYAMFEDLLTKERNDTECASDVLQMVHSKEDPNIRRSKLKENRYKSITMSIDVSMLSCRGELRIKCPMSYDLYHTWWLPVQITAGLTVQYPVHCIMLVRLFCVWVILLNITKAWDQKKKKKFVVQFLCRVLENHSGYILPDIFPNRFINYAGDNLDLSEDMINVEAKTLHETVMAIYENCGDYVPCCLW